MERTVTQGAHLMRNPAHVVLTGCDHVLFVGPVTQPLRVPVADPADWSRFLATCAAPYLCAAHSCPPELDSGLLERLLEEGHLLTENTPQALVARRHEVMSSCPTFNLEPPDTQIGHVLFGCTGSVIAGLVPQTVLSLVLTGFQRQLDVILTETAQRFLTRDLLEAYGVRCWSSGFERQDGLRLPHVNLAMSADVICILPATANSMERIARSACSDLLSLTITASHAPVVICPAMNGAMWSNRGVQRNAERLRRDGRYIMEPTVLFAAADFTAGAQPGYGGHGTLWAGPKMLMRALASVAVIGIDGV